MKEKQFHDELLLPWQRDELFPFFAEARNLEALTPPWLKFEVVTRAPIEMRPGALIDYRIRIHGIPIRWRTEIVEWNPPHGFVDVQLSGPYKLWHHIHTFEERGASTLCRDDVRYWPRGGELMDRFFVRRDVERIFAFRRQALRKIFSAPAQKSVEGSVIGSTAARPA